jgi:hypothetical protein
MSCGELIGVVNDREAEYVKYLKERLQIHAQNFKYEQHDSRRKIFNITNQDKKVVRRLK